ncbi:MAG: hypothetical protein K5756_07185 [Clostridiales bacterium]|nr:hypothetical protein [Clostridiales bacterium]
MEKIDVGAYNPAALKNHNTYLVEAGFHARPCVLFDFADGRTWKPSPTRCG